MAESKPETGGPHDGSSGAPDVGRGYPALNKSTAIDSVGNLPKKPGTVGVQSQTTAIDHNTGETFTVDIVSLDDKPKVDTSTGKESHEGSQKNTPDDNVGPHKGKKLSSHDSPTKQRHAIDFNHKNDGTGNGGNTDTEKRSIIDMTFIELNKARKDYRQTAAEKMACQSEYEKRVKEFLEISDDMGGTLAEDVVGKAIKRTLSECKWDEIDRKLDELARVLESQFEGTSGVDYKRYGGIIKQAIQSEKAKVLLLGIKRKNFGNNSRSKAGWIKDKFYPKEVEKIYETKYEEDHILPEDFLGVQEILNLVVKDTKKEENILPQDRDSMISQQILKKLDEISKHQERAASLQDEQLELMKKGLKGFIHGVVRRSHVSPEQYDQQLPPWFEVQGNEKQKMLTNILHINYLAAVKRDTGMSSLDGWLGTQGLSIERDSLDFMNRNLPGFREALATMKQEIFIQGANHLIISKQGYKLVGSEELLNKYKLELTNKIATILRLKFGDFYEKEYRVSNEDLAALSVATVDNFFFGMGAYDSGDEARKIAPGDKNVYSGAIRTSMMPGINAKDKWRKNESFGGKLGDWMRENIKYDRGFRNLFNKGKIDFIPDRIYYSGLDHCDFEKTSKLKFQTLAEVLLSRDMVVYENGVYDFKDGADAVPFKELAGHDILGYYADVRGSAVKLYKHITIAEPKDRTLPGLVDALTKIKGDKLLAPLTKNEDFILACIAMVASPETGFVRGTTKTVIDVDTSIHGTKIFNAINDAKLFQGMKFGSRNKILNRLYYDVLFEKSRLERIKRIADRNAYRISHPSLLRRLINAIFRQ